MHAGILPQLEVAYETWGELNDSKDNAILLHTGLSASSHAASHPVGTLSRRAPPWHSVQARSPNGNSLLHLTFDS